MAVNFTKPLLSSRASGTSFKKKSDREWRYHIEAKAEKRTAKV